MGSVNRVLGDGAIVTDVSGKEWKLSGCTKRVQKNFEQWLEARVRAGAVAAKQSLSEEDYIQLLAATEENIALDRYAWAQAACIKAIQQPAGVVELTRLLLELHHGRERLKPADVEQLLDDNGELFGSAIRSILGLEHPNSEPPAAVTPAEEADAESMQMTAMNSVSDSSPPS